MVLSAPVDSVSKGIPETLASRINGGSGTREKGGRGGGRLDGPLATRTESAPKEATG